MSLSRRGTPTYSLTLSVWPANARARALYEAAGFAEAMVRLRKPLG